MQELYNAAQMDINAIMCSGTKASVARQEALLKKHNITRLNPMLGVSSGLSEHLAAGVEKTSSWLKVSAFFSAPRVCEHRLTYERRIRFRPTTVQAKSSCGCWWQRC